MSEPKFTPGPWEVCNLMDVFSASGASNSEGVAADSDDGWQIADCMVGKTFVNGELLELSSEEQMANARLIAAAPELLDAIKLILPLAKGYRPSGQTETARKTCDRWIAVAEEIVAKAEGRS